MCVDVMSLKHLLPEEDCMPHHVLARLVEVGRASACCWKVDR